MLQQLQSSASVPLSLLTGPLLFKLLIKYSYVRPRGQRRASRQQVGLPSDWLLIREEVWMGKTIGQRRSSNGCLFFLFLLYSCGGEQRTAATSAWERGSEGAWSTAITASKGSDQTAALQTCRSTCMMLNKVLCCKTKKEKSLRLGLCFLQVLCLLILA